VRTGLQTARRRGCECATAQPMTIDWWKEGDETEMLRNPRFCRIEGFEINSQISSLSVVDAVQFCGTIQCRVLRVTV
jgi:hypothetical protein